MVKPSWSRRHAAPNQSVVVLDPGLSFGTGQHPTTAFCLLHLVRFRQPRSPQSLLDIGTGSGILAISAAKLGYAPVDAFDIDPESLRVCRLNACGNRVNHRIHFSLKNLASFTPQSQKYYSVICANLVSDLLIEHRARIAGRLEPDGILLLAGILAKEFAAVQRAYEQSGLWLVRSRLQREWRSGVFRWRAQAPRQR
jgi:ribosomal protein L11 methyltransferase